MPGNHLFKMPFKPRVAELLGTRPPVSSTKKDCGTKISGNPKTNFIAYCSDCYVVVLPLHKPLKAFVYEGHNCETTVARFSPDGDVLASADIGGSVQVWKPGGDPVLIKKKSLWSRIIDLQWSPDGISLMVCGFDVSKPFVRIFIWDSDCDGYKFDGHSHPVLSCDFSPKPPYHAVTSGRDSLVNFYSGSLIQLLRSNRECSDCMHCESFSSVSSEQIGNIYAGSIGVKVGKSLNQDENTGQISNKEHSDCVHCVRYSPSGDRFISVSSDQKGIIYDGSTGAMAGHLLNQDENTGQIFSVSWSSDNKHVITASENSANIWEITYDNLGILKKTLRCLGSDGMDMFVGCLWLNDNIVLVSLGGTISVYPAKEMDKPSWSLFGHRTCVNFVSCSVQSNQKVISSCSTDGMIMRWMPDTGYGREVKRKDKTPIKCFATAGDTIILNGNENNVKRITLNYDTDCNDEVDIHISSQPIDLSIALDACDISLVATSSSVIILKCTTVLSRTDFEFQVSASTISPDGCEVIVGDQTGKLHIYSVNEDHTLRLKDVRERHIGPITGVKYSPNGYFFASVDALRESVVWVCSSHEMKLKDLFHHWDTITSIAWSPDSRRVATGSNDCDIMVYDLQQHPSTRVIIKHAHRHFVYGLAFIDDDILASCGGDGCVRLWKVA